jgi:hypothetical protein
LVDPTTLGVGEGAKLILSVGGLEEELKVLEGLMSEEATKGTEVEPEMGNKAGLEANDKERVEGGSEA